MARVALVNLTKRFDEVVAVRDMTLTIEDREFVVLLGPSGCGKTTTLRMIAGLEEITEGELYIGDRLVNHVPPKDRDIAMVFQNYALYPHMTVYDNMAFGLKLRRLPKEEIRRRVLEAAELLGLQDLLHRKPKALSGGQRQRVAVGRAIVRHPQVFLFDEPLSNLDAKLRVQMRVELKKLHERLQATSVYVTHDQIEAMTMGDRIVVMRDGMVQQVGTPLEVYDHPRTLFVAGFIGNPPMNFVEGVILRQGEAFLLKTGGFQVPIPPERTGEIRALVDRKVIFGIRPEDIREALPGDPPEQMVEAVVEVVEPIGAEILLDVKVGPDPLTASVDAHTRVRPHQKIKLFLRLEKMHLFDPETETALL